MKVLIDMNLPTALVKSADGRGWRQLTALLRLRWR